MADESGTPAIPEPTETIRMPAPSWSPAVLAFGALGIVAGAFATGFMFPPLWFAILGVFLAFFGLRSMIRRGVRSYYGLPREQDQPRAELPVDSFGPPRLD
jgi:hypothetical protein